MIGIIDYGMGNLGSVTNACRFLELDARVITTPSEMDECNALILPGVGAFGDCMEHLQDHGFVEPIKSWVAADKPLLGICLGLQVLFASSEESPGVAGLGILPGTVRLFSGTELKVPQIGWNQVQQKQDIPVFRGIKDDAFYYFVHSYYVDCEESGVIAASTEYGIEYTCAIARGNLFAVQFHPEKSQKNGLDLLRNFSEHVYGGASA